MIIRKTFLENYKETLDPLLIEGYRSIKEEDKKINNEWEKITLENWE